MLVNNILDVVFPRFCLGCGYVGRYICPRCEMRLEKEKNQPHCIYCKKRSFLGLTHPACKRKDGVDGYISTYPYNGLFKKIIHASKYDGAHEVLKELMCVSIDKSIEELFKWRRLSSFSIQAVPLHREKLNERGFNQADLIASPISKLFGSKTIKVLKKEKRTQSQATLSTHSERLNNIKGSFACVSSLPPENILLVDDVVTTGATVKECARVLKRNGARRVYLFSLARG